MVSACRQWRPLKDVPSVTRQVAAGGQLCPPPLSDLSGPTMLPSIDPWADILFEARLLRRLRQGPIEVGPEDAYLLAELSPNAQHLMLLGQDGRRTIRHLDGLGRKRTSFPTHRIGPFFQFTAHGHGLVASASLYGPIQLFDLTAHARRPRIIAPRAHYGYRNLVTSPDGKFYIFSCNDGSLRSYTSETSGFMRLCGVFPFGQTVYLYDVSENGKTLVAKGDDDRHYQVYCNPDGMAWRKACKIVDPHCCSELSVSPLGRFILSTGCGTSGLYPIDPNSSAPDDVLEADMWPGWQILSPDETQVAFREAEGFEVYRWPDLKKIGTYASGWHDDLRWLRPYLEWLDRRLAVGIDLEDDKVWRIRLR